MPRDSSLSKVPLYEGVVAGYESPACTVARAAMERARGGAGWRRGAAAHRGRRAVAHSGFAISRRDAHCCCLHLLEDGGRGRPSTPCTLPSQSTFTQSHAWLAYTGRTTRTIGAWRAAGRRRRTAGTARRRARPWKRALKVDEVFSPSPCFLGECRQVECWQPSHVHLGWPPQ